MKLRTVPSLNEFANPCADQVLPFVASLEHTRMSMPKDEWRRTVRTSPVIGSWRFFLCMDPYTRWGLIKPRGYAGDATLMDFAYGHRSIDSHIAAIGPIATGIYAATSGAKQSKSARDRIELLRDEIAGMTARQRTAVISVASGHARELETLTDSTRRQISSFTAVDLDSASLQEAKESAGPIPFKAICRNVIKDELDSIEHGDLVYSLGLFDYLANEQAIVVLDKMLGLTRPGGKCIVANLAPDAANLGYCEAIMDWWMVTRSEEDMIVLGSACTAGKSGAFSLKVRRTGCFHYLQITSKQTAK